MRTRILVTGSRTWTALALLRETLTHWRAVYPHAVLVHGGARGVDQFAAGIWTGWRLPVEAHPADWTYGPIAGFLRNQAVVDLGAHVCLAFIRDHSHGATHCATAAEAAGIPTYRYRQDASRP